MCNYCNLGQRINLGDVEFSTLRVQFRDIRFKMRNLVDECTKVACVLAFEGVEYVGIGLSGVSC